MIKRFLALSIIPFILLVVGSSVVVAQTPDELTPFEEIICEDLSGASFGLCNAYCEAMDCDSATPQASSTACAKVKSRYKTITGFDRLPCDPLPPGDCVPDTPAPDWDYWPAVWTGPWSCQCPATGELIPFGETSTDPETFWGLCTANGGYSAGLDNSSGTNYCVCRRR